MKSSPWGAVQQEYEIAPGIVQVSTASHGGIKLCAERNRQVPEPMRNDSGWYEEDCEAYVPLWVFPAEFAAWSQNAGWYPADSPYVTTEGTRSKAAQSLRSWMPDEWTAVTGEVVTAEQSHVIAEREFAATHANDWVTTAAFGSWHDEVPAGMVGVVAKRGGRRSDSESRYFLVPDAEYDSRSSFGFVIDLERHQPWPTSMDTTTKELSTTERQAA